MFQIWVSAEPGGDVLTMWASLVDASTLDVVRQTSFDVRPGYFPASRSLMFPEYVVPDGQRLLLQLQVAEHEHNYVVYRLTQPRSDLANLMLNGVPDAGSGPLTFVHLRTGSGMRAAIDGEPAERIRAVLAFVFSVLTISMYLCALGSAQRFFSLARNFAQPRLNQVQRMFVSDPVRDSNDQPTRIRRVLSVPWYPWAVATVPILNFLVSNPLHFSVSEAAIPLAVALLVVTVLVAGLRLVFVDWHRPAAIVSCVVAIFFAYGHIERVFHGLVHETLFFAAAVTLAAAGAVLASRARRVATRSTQFFNLTAAVVLAFPVASLAAGMIASYRPAPASQLSSLDDLASHLLPEGIPVVDSQKPDVYYIILDCYSRHDTLGNFDNSDFLNGLRSRGFYVAMQATSNYNISIQSIPSSLNMSYLDDLGDRTPRSKQDLVDASHWNALAAILKRLGYTYVHLESGHILTDRAPLADVAFTFTPSGSLVRSEVRADAGPPSLISSEKFIRHLLVTTAAKTILSANFSIGSDVSPYDWWSPHRALQMFDVLAGEMPYAGPKFVFAHIVKPHLPATFDQYGNHVASQSYYDSLDDSHDPDVPNAYVGQLIYINSLVLEAVDGILESSDRRAIIAIASDHSCGEQGTERDYPILAAFHLPDDGDVDLYHSITSVNHFRYILDHYFDLGIGMAEDLQIINNVDKYNFTANNR